MIRQEKDGIVWLQFELLLQFKRLKHAVFLKHGGVSQGCYSSLNASLSVGDDPSLVEQNRRIIRDCLSEDFLVSPHQIHGNVVEEISDENKEKKMQCDGLMTKKPHIPLMITHADCQAAIFYDPQKNVCSVVHAGWRGSIKNIYEETVLKMKTHFRSNPKDIHVGISPSLGPMHAEFINYKNELPRGFWKYQIKENMFDFWQISQEKLESTGISSNNIQISRLCTFANSSDYFSYRRDKVTGRHATLACLC